uniref:G protein-activated inward rectifier potassium channel 2 n=1 Tax=Aceria tosichella TaxID=561515 RepID=A0A6G1S6J7_9ACAR
MDNKNSHARWHPHHHHHDNHHHHHHLNNMIQHSNSNRNNTDHRDHSNSNLNNTLTTMTTTSDDTQKELLSDSSLGNDLRRFSLPTTISTSMCHSSSETGDHHSSGHLSSAMGGLDQQAPVAAVAGVGGTITTVTRSKRKTAPLPRLVGKNGQVNLFLDNIDRRQYVRDLFTTMIDIKWRYNLMAAAFGFVFSWLFFACIWYAVLYFHNDLDHENDPAWSPCIVNVHSFPAALLFSIETQSTLGFGSRIISVECPGAIVIFCIQLIFGVVVECLIVGMVFAKLSRPTKRSQTIMYSKYATVCLREAKMCLTFRVGDVRSKSHIIGATLRASLVSSKLTKEGELIPFYHHNLNVIIDDNCKNSLLLIWPVTVVHVIDESSPFFKLNSDELANFKFEIITVLEGTVESTGQSIQVRSSYLPSEVKWGYRFEPIVSTHGYGRYAQTIIDYNKFNRIIEVSTPKCSPMEYYANERALESEATATPIIVEE